MLQFTVHDVALNSISRCNSDSTSHHRQRSCSQWLLYNVPVCIRAVSNSNTGHGHGTLRILGKGGKSFSSTAAVSGKLETAVEYESRKCRKPVCF